MWYNLFFTKSLPVVFFYLIRDPLVISSKILSVTVRPPPKPTEPLVVVELAPLLNVSERSLHTNKHHHLNSLIFTLMHAVL